MEVQLAYRLFFILDLVSHGMSVPIFPNYDDTQTDGYQEIDDIMDPYERFPRNTVSSPDFWQKDHWFTRSLIPSQPRHASRRHYHLFHLTSRHPNAVSYHVIEKPHHKTTASVRHRAESSLRRSDLYDNDVTGQNYPVQSYYQQPATTYQYPGYPAGYGSSYPQIPYGAQQNNGAGHDSTYDDILQEVSKPMNLPNRTPTYASYSQSIRQNDQVPSIEEAAKEFKLASADMNNMELASLVMYPLPRFNIGDKQTAHKKKSKRKQKKYVQKVQAPKSKSKSKDQGEGVDSLVENLVKSDKHVKNGAHVDDEEKQQLEKDEKEKEKIKIRKEDEKTEEKKVRNKDKEEKQKENEKKTEDEDKMGDEEKESIEKDSWNEGNIPTKEEEKYLSSKRSEIPHVLDEISNSDEDKDESDGKDNTENIDSFETDDQSVYI